MFKWFWAIFSLGAPATVGIQFSLKLSPGSFHFHIGSDTVVLTGKNNLKTKSILQDLSKWSWCGNKTSGNATGYVLIVTTFKLLSSDMTLHSEADLFLSTSYYNFIDFDKVRTLNDHALIILIHWYILDLHLMI